MKLNFRNCVEPRARPVFFPNAKEKNARVSPRTGKVAHYLSLSRARDFAD